MKRNIFFIPGLILLFCLLSFRLFSVSPVFAYSSEDIQKLRGDILKFLAQEKGSFLEKDIFSKIVDLFCLEVRNIKEKLRKTQTFSFDQENLRKELLKRFSQFSQYLDSFIIEQENLGTKEKAKILVLWRENEYLPCFNQASNFFLLLRAKKIIKFSLRRLDKTESFIKKHQKNPHFSEMKEYYNQAKSLIDEGVKEINQKEKLFLQKKNIFLPPSLRSGLEKIKQGYDYFLKLAI